MALAKTEKHLNRVDTIWRYMSLAELITILERRRLVFHQFRKLRRSDRREGAIPKDLYDLDQILSEDSDAKLKGLRANEDLRFSTYVQCWNRARQEHSAFWQIYGNRGVAVVSHVSKLQVQAFWNQLSLHGKDIVYADSWAAAIRKGLHVPSGITPNRGAMRLKRRAFSWEHEWRIFYKPAPKGFIWATLPGDERELQRRALLSKWPPFEEIAFESLDWISKVVIAPQAPKWVVSSISDVAGRHGVRCEESKI